MGRLSALVGWQDAATRQLQREARAAVVDKFPEMGSICETDAKVVQAVVATRQLVPALVWTAVAIGLLHLANADWLRDWCAAALAASSLGAGSIAAASWIRFALVAIRIPGARYDWVRYRELDADSGKIRPE